MTSHIFSEPPTQCLEQLFTAATRHASIAMCRWTNGQITLAVDEIREAPLEEASEAFGPALDLVTMVVLGIQGELGGQLTLTFDDLNGRKLAAALLHRDVPDQPEWTELEKSAVMETGNILSSAYLSELTRLTDRELVPTPPYFLQDFGASVLEQSLMAQAVESDTVLICRTRFEFNQQALDWNVFFVPSQELLQLLKGTVGGDPDAR